MMLIICDDNLKTQQTPNEEAHVPLAVPPLAVHSLKLNYMLLYIFLKLNFQNFLSQYI